MKRLLLFRHAKSSWSEPGLPDHERPLAARGQGAAGAMGQAIEGLDLVPQRALCSTAVRNRQTLHLAAKSWARQPQTAYLSALYHAGIDELLDTVRSAAAAAASLMLVGHQPGLQNFALALAGQAERAARARLQAKFPTAALAVIEFELDDWRDLRPGAGRLIRYLCPRDLES